jgi:hypothetical protein
VFSNLAWYAQLLFLTQIHIVHDDCVIAWMQMVKLLGHRRRLASLNGYCETYLHSGCSLGIHGLGSGGDSVGGGSSSSVAHGGSSRGHVLSRVGSRCRSGEGGLQARIVLERMLFRMQTAAARFLGHGNSCWNAICHSIEGRAIWGKR